MYVFFKVSIHVQQTTQLKHYAAYNTEEGETTDWQQTAEERENERQRDAKMNWNSWQPRNRKQKKFQTSGNKHLFKYINIYNRVYQRYTGPEKERKQRETEMKHGCGEFKKEECRHRGLLKLKRITEAECKGKEQKRKYKKWEMQKWHTNAEKEWRKICRIQI